MHRFSRKIYILFLLILMTLSTFATEGVFSVPQKEVIKIGYCENYGTLLEDAPSDRRGYGFEYLTRLARISGVELKFIKCNWEEAFDLLESGEIDIFGPVQKTADREERFGFPDERFGFEQGYLLAHKDAPVYYEDFEHFDNKTVGVVERTYFLEVLEHYCQAHSFTLDYVSIEANTASEQLKNGQIDLFLAGSLTTMPEAKVVARLSTEPFYYVTRKDDAQTLGWMNASMQRLLQDDLYYPTLLHEKYYGQQQNKSVAFTRQEIQLAQSYPKLVAAVLTNDEPLQYFDAASNQFKGISIDFLRKIAANCAIELEFVDIANIGEQQVDLYAAPPPLFSGVKPEKSKAYYTASMVLASARYQNSKETGCIALPKIYSTLKSELVNRYPDLDIRQYDTPQSAIGALKANQVDFMLLTGHMFEVLHKLYPTDTFALHQTDIKMPLQLSFASHLPDGIVRLFDKGIATITQSQTDAIVFANTASLKKDFSVMDFVTHYSYELLSAATVVFSILLLLIAMVVHMQKALRQSAYTDEITGAYTFLKFKQEAAEILKNASPYQYALISIDIDNFKYINSIFGYEIGNEVLRAVYQSSKEYLDRDTIVARVNADKFVFLTNTHKYSAPSLVYSSEKALNMRAQELLGEFYNLALSIGVYTIENPAEDLSIMLDWANMANKSSKKHYDSRLVLFTNEMKKDLKNRRDITVDKERAMENNEFIAFFQPKYNLKTLEICGAELLVRWNKEDKMLPPCEFIPVFEQNGFIKKLDLFMFQRACSVISTWKQSYTKPIPRISVNLSPITFTSEFLVENLIQISSKHGVSSSDLEIEITESVLMHDVRKVREILSRLRNAGFTITIDDFGSRYSSLNALKELPVDVIKLDREFISYGFSDTKVCTIVSSVINMAKELNLETVAEGIETQEQSNMLKNFGCDIVQGYYYSRPISKRDFERLYFTEKERL